MNKLIIIAFALGSLCTHAQELKRSASLGVQFEYQPEATIVAAVEKSNPLYGKLKAGDTLVSINEIPTKIYPELVAALSQFSGGDKFTMIVKGSKERKIKGTFLAKPGETSEFGEVIYDQVAYKEGQLRVIMNKPAESKEKYPAILFVPGYTCSSVDNLFPSHPYKRIIDAYHKAGFVTLRVEKSGLGDSKNTPPCESCDLKDEIENFQVGLDKLKSIPYVDADKIVIVGHSMGGIIAPALAAKNDVAGVTVYGTCAKSWFEYTLEMYRVQNLLAGMDPIEYEQSILDQYEVAYRYFVKGEPLEEVAKDSTNLAILEEFWMYDGTGTLLGRNAEYWRQIQDINHIENWKNSDAKVLVQFGTSDFQAFSEENHAQIVRTVNHYRPGTAELQVFPDTDHYYAASGTMQDAWDKFNQGQYQQLFQEFNFDVTKKMVDWSLDVVK